MTSFAFIAGLIPLALQQDLEQLVTERLEQLLQEECSSELFSD
jgi:multidrug efflux pump subunit AcrB